MKPLLILGLVLLCITSSLAQQDVVIGEKEIVGPLPPCFDNNPQCAIEKVEYIWINNGDFHVEGNSVIFQPTTLGLQTDSLIVKISYKSGLHCPPYSFGGQRYFGIGTSDSILRVRPKVLTVDMIPDTLARVYRGSFEMEFGNNIAASAIFRQWQLGNFDSTLYDLQGQIDSQIVYQVASAAFQQRQKVRFTLVFRLGPFWTDTTISTKFLTFVDSQQDSTYSNTINLVFKKLNKSTFVKSSLAPVNVIFPVGDQQIVHNIVACDPSIQSISCSPAYPFKVMNFVGTGEKYEFDILLGPASRGVHWVHTPLLWRWNDFSGKSRYDSIMVELTITVTPLPVSPASIKFTGSPWEFKDIQGRMVNKPTLSNIRILCRPPLISPSITNDVDSIRFVLRGKPIHSDLYKDSFLVEYDVTDAYGNKHPDHSAASYEIEMDFNEWSRTNWPDSLAIIHLAAGSGDSVYAVTNSNAVYFSSDAGRLWKLIKQFEESVSEFVTNTAGIPAVILDFSRIELLAADGTSKKLTGGPYKPRRVFTFGDDFIVRGSAPYPGDNIGNFVLQVTDSLTYLYTHKSDCNQRMRYVLNPNYAVSFTCNQDNNFSNGCALTAPTPTNDDFQIEYLAKQMFTGDATGIWKTWLSPWEKYSSDNVVDIKQRKNRLAFACADHSILTLNGILDTHRYRLGLEDLDIKKMALSDTTIYIATKDHRIYRTYIKGDILGVSSTSNQPERTLIIRPNPTKQKFTFEAPDGISINGFQIVNNLGAVVMAKEALQDNTIDVSKLSSGTYLLIGRTKEGALSGSFVIQR
jgi:hypothetical protein